MVWKWKNDEISWENRLKELNKSFSFEELRFALGIPGEVTLSKLEITNLLESNEKWNRYLKE